MNVPGAGAVATAPDREAAMRFIGCLDGGHRAQRTFAVGNREYPVVGDAPAHAALAASGASDEGGLRTARSFDNAARGLRIMQRAGWR